MNIQKIKALLEALENAKNEKEKLQLVDAIIAELQALSDELKASGKTLTKTKARILTTVITKISFVLIEHELASDAISLIRKLLKL